MSLEIIPRGHRLLIKRDDFAKSAGIIQLSEKHREYSQLATVIAVGDGPEVESFKVGDRILVTPWSGITVFLYNLRDTLDESIRMVSVEEVLATIKE